MKKTLKRLFARLCLLGWLLGAVLFAIGAITRVPEVVAAALGVWLAAFIARYALLRCPNCGYLSAPPQWKKSGTISCPQCGKPFEYDK